MLAVLFVKVYNTPEMQRRTRVCPPDSDVDRDRIQGSNKNRSSGGVSSKGSDGRRSSTSSGHGHQSFLECIFSHLAEAREELESLAAKNRSNGIASKATSGSEALAGATSVLGGDAAGAGVASAERETQAVRVRLERCLTLVKGVIRGAPGVMTAAHSNRGMGLPGEITVIVKTSAAKHPSGASTNVSSIAAAVAASSAEGSSAPSHAAPPPLTGPSPLSAPPDRYILEVHPMETIGLLRVRVAATNGSGKPADHTRLLSGGKALTMDDKTCEEAGIADGSSVYTLVNSNALLLSGLGEPQAERARHDEAKRRAVGAMHDGDVVAMQTGPFDELFRLLECAHGMEVSPREYRQVVHRESRVCMQQSVCGDEGGPGSILAFGMPWALHY